MSDSTDQTDEALSKSLLPDNLQPRDSILNGQYFELDTIPLTIEDFLNHWEIAHGKLEERWTRMFLESPYTKAIVTFHPDLILDVLQNEKKLKSILRELNLRDNSSNHQSETESLDTGWLQNFTGPGSHLWEEGYVYGKDYI
jgi:hypothetical protein